MRGRFRKVVWEWLTKDLPPDPTPERLPLAEPAIAEPTCVDGEVRVTWVGHASLLVQLPGLNLLTDPVWSERVSPVRFTGSRRFVPPVPELDALPEIHGVLLSHDHYDHLDRPTVKALHARFGRDLVWYTPLGYRDWFSRLGIRSVVERDWWESAEVPGGRYTLAAAPTRHWTRRTPWGTNRRLWASWAVLPADPSDPRVWFGGDTAYASCFEEIGGRLGPFDVSLIPIGAYEPRWFMGASHVNPEEAVQIYRDVGGRGAFLPTHWGTFRLTFEDPLEPPERLRKAWADAGLPEGDLYVLNHGETVVLTV